MSLISFLATHPGYAISITFDRGRLISTIRKGELTVTKVFFAGEIKTFAYKEELDTMLAEFMVKEIEKKERSNENNV